MASTALPQSFAFVFPMASGHINPSLPIARRLVELGHEAHYLCREQMREAVEDTGARFHSEIEREPELYEGREPGMYGAMEDLKREHGLEGDGLVHAGLKLREILLELMLPGVLRWLREVQAGAVVYCPLMSSEAGFAARVLGIPGVALLTTAGPGSMAKATAAMLAMQGLAVPELLEAREAFEPLRHCRQRLEARYGIVTTSMLEPLGLSEGLLESSLALVTTCEALQDECPEGLAEAYRQAGVRFEAVGPLLDVEGARRAAGHRFSTDGERQPGLEAGQEQDPQSLAQQARAAGRKVVLASMGTVITGDNPDFGWEARMPLADGTRKGLTGRQLCRAAWGGAFDALGSAEEGAPLLLLATGPQPSALEGLEVPANAVCVPRLPQVDLLKAGVDLFLTHGGQNSFTEALDSGVPLVVCPGFADQPINGQKAQDMGLGLQVERPMPEEGAEEAAAEAYRGEVAAAIRAVLCEERFRLAAARCGEQLRSAGGVPRAVELVLSLAAVRAGVEVEAISGA